jgi:acyl carrier protein
MLTADRAEVLEQLKEAFLRLKDGEVDTSKVTEDAVILGDLGFDSLDLLELRFELESVWGIKVADEEAVKLQTVGKVVDLIMERGK